jgi:hypothetical protein
MVYIDFEMSADDVANGPRCVELSLKVCGGDEIVDRGRRLTAGSDELVHPSISWGAPGETGRVRRQSQNLTRSVIMRALRMRAMRGWATNLSRSSPCIWETVGADIRVDADAPDGEWREPFQRATQAAAA